MPTRFQNRFTAHAVPVLEREHSVEVVLIRKGVRTAVFSARHGQRISVALGASLGLDIKHDTMIWKLPVGDVVLDGTETRPQPKDQLREVLDGVDQAEIWEVFAPDSSTPPADLSHSRYDWVTQTQLVAE